MHLELMFVDVITPSHSVQSQIQLTCFPSCLLILEVFVAQFDGLDHLHSIQIHLWKQSSSLPLVLGSGFADGTFKEPHNYCHRQDTVVTFVIPVRNKLAQKYNDKAIKILRQLKVGLFVIGRSCGKQLQKAESEDRTQNFS